MAIEPNPPMGMRNEHAQAQLEQDNEKNVKDRKERDVNALAHERNYHESVVKDLEKAFDVTIATTRETQHKRLEQLTQSQQKQIEDEAERGRAEVEMTRGRYQEQIAQYRENAEKLMEGDEKKTAHALENMKRMHDRELG